MKSLVLAASILAVSATASFAQGYAPWGPGRFPYAERHHNICQEKAQRLHMFERRAASDGRIDRREQRIIAELRYDLNRTCGGFRHRGW